MAGVADVEAAGGSHPVDWRRNAAALATSQFTVVFGFSFVLPFLPVYLRNELGVHNPSELALWSGFVTGGSGLMLAIANPLWGMVSDRLGRKPMIVRAMLGGALCVAAAGLAQAPLQLLGVRLLTGLLGGTVPASTALVVAETPPPKVGRALGMLGAGMALGRTLGPLLGGVLAALFTLRSVFIGTGVFLMSATLIVILFARETTRPVSGSRVQLGAVRSIPVNARTAIGALVAVQGLTQLTFGACQQLLVLKLLALDQYHAQLTTGFAFSVGGLAAVAAAGGYWRVAELTGYRRFLLSAAAVLGVSALLLAAAPTIGLAIASSCLGNLASGAIGPALSTMLGLEAPAALKGTIFGVNASALSLGAAIGFVSSGAVTSVIGVEAALMMAAVVAAAALAVVLRWGREPAPALA